MFSKLLPVCVIAGWTFSIAGCGGDRPVVPDQPSIEIEISLDPEAPGDGDEVIITVRARAPGLSIDSVVAWVTDVSRRRWHESGTGTSEHTFVFGYGVPLEDVGTIGVEARAWAGSVSQSTNRSFAPTAQPVVVSLSRPAWVENGVSSGFVLNTYARHGLRDGLVTTNAGTTPIEKNFGLAINDRWGFRLTPIGPIPPGDSMVIGVRLTDNIGTTRDESFSVVVADRTRPDASLTVAGGRNGSSFYFAVSDTVTVNITAVDNHRMGFVVHAQDEFNLWTGPTWPGDSVPFPEGSGMLTLRIPVDAGWADPNYLERTIRVDVADSSGNAAPLDFEFVVIDAAGWGYTELSELDVLDGVAFDELTGTAYPFHGDSVFRVDLASGNVTGRASLAGAQLSMIDVIPGTDSLLYASEVTDHVGVVADPFGAMTLDTLPVQLAEVGQPGFNPSSVFAMANGSYFVTSFGLILEIDPSDWSVDTVATGSFNARRQVARSLDRTAMIATGNPSTYLGVAADSVWVVTGPDLRTVGIPLNLAADGSSFKAGSGVYDADFSLISSAFHGHSVLSADGNSLFGFQLGLVEQRALDGSLLGVDVGSVPAEGVYVLGGGFLFVTGRPPGIFSVP